ncbi:MAG: hypothetical protein SGPRY_002817 [Prymnesium sp.]
MEARCVSLSSVRTDFTADAVAFCPYEGYRHLLACGCYQLMNDESPPRRTGQLLLFDATHADSPRELQCFDGPGVLDCQWLPVSAASPNLLVTASAEGGAHFYRLESGESPQPKLHDVGLLECEGAGWCIGLACSLPTAGASRIALGGTSGTVHVCAVATEGERLERSWQAHELECWAVGWAAHPEAAMTLFSGADDAMLKSWDLRCDPTQGAVAVACNRRSHGAGVCCISPSPLRPQMIATGSYDEKVRLWDARQLRQPLEEVRPVHCIVTVESGGSNGILRGVSCCWQRACMQVFAFSRYSLMVPWKLLPSILLTEWELLWHMVLIGHTQKLQLTVD